MSTSKQDKNTTLMEQKHHDCIIDNTRIFFVWDFDHTVVNCNSDEYVPAKILGVKETTQLFLEYWAQHTNNWHKCVELVMEKAMQKARDQNQDEEKEIQKIAATMPYLMEVKNALEDIYKCQHQSHPDSERLKKEKEQCISNENQYEKDFQTNDIHQMILSDGNTYFIQSFLNGTEFYRYFNQGIITNIGTMESNESNTMKNFLVTPYAQNKPNGCPLPPKSQCPDNLCKTEALFRILKNSSHFYKSRSVNNTVITSRPKIVYVGDGGNDACPALHVLTSPKDVILARSGYKPIYVDLVKKPLDSGALTDEEAFSSLPPMNDSNSGGYGILPKFDSLKKKFDETPKCQIKVWKTGTELCSHINECLTSSFMSKNEEKDKFKISIEFE